MPERRPEHKIVLIGERPLYFTQTWYATPAWLKNKFPSYLFWISRNSNAQFFYDEIDISGQKKLWKKVWKNPRWLLEQVEFFRKYRHNLIQLFKGLELENKTEQELVKLYRIWIEFYSLYTGEGNAYARLVDRYGLERLRESLAKIKGLEDTDHAITVLTALDRESYLSEEERIFWQGLIKTKNNAQIVAFVQSHQKKYAWVGRSYMEEPALGFKDFKKRYTALDRSKWQAKSFSFDKHLQNNKDQVQKLVRHYALNKDIQKQASILRLAAYLKDYTRGVVAEVYFYSDKLFDELEKRSALKRDVIKNLTIEELANILLKHKKIDRKLLKKRMIGPYLVYIKNGRTAVLYGKQVQQFEQKYLSDDSMLGLKEFKGRPACLGEASGIVRVVQNLEQVKSLKSSEILVVNNTNPAFVPYLRKAGAIIAAEGGITVHAAIVSRELKIPCIVGIRNVTRLLKTGQKVYVNATKGIVKIL